ncbi:DUF1080 domain-containing protein [Occallatibacter riparius]|uniref:DUF1080 domain-containing protein n=1 Tax=Occallatibacter riparius TaxID=1002689 RepID=A0A9J7BNM1_9BACT|nr:DUF1080 domain-containing protein [Occallatibacter riparius]UWZ82502.1 DUF1080 domain-containing protein [Occallatibacter riparius]
MSSFAHGSHWMFLLLAATLGCCMAQSNATAPASAPQNFALTDASALAVTGGKAEAADYLGRKAVRLTTAAESDIFAFVNGSNLQDGAIDVDLAIKITTPPGVRMPGFTGLAFRSRSDGSHYDMFYLRPRNSLAEDQAMRNHSVQYVAKPDYDWYPLRRQWPWVYEAWADLKPETWTHVQIELHGRTARLFLNGSKLPSLVINGLKGEDLKGGIALWGYPGEESYFSNLRITPSSPVPLCNCGEPAGTWHVALGTDYGRFEGTLDLNRDGPAISGTWSGALGDSRPVTGRWRDGYVELSFTGDWKDGNEKPVPFTARLAGWFDGDTASGRVALEGRADGIWTAERKK